MCEVIAWCASRPNGNLLACRKAIVEQVNQLIEAYIHLAALPASSDVSSTPLYLLFFAWSVMKSSQVMV